MYHRKLSIRDSFFPNMRLNSMWQRQRTDGTRRRGRAGAGGVRWVAKVTELM